MIDANHNLYWIYCIQNKINGKKYIGFSINPQRRWKQHIKLSNRKVKNQYIHKAISKYGENNFWFGCIGFSFTETEALEQEKLCIKFNKTNNSLFGYNLTEGGEGSSGYKHTKEAKIKLSDAGKLKVGVLNPFYGKTHTQQVVNLSKGENNKSSKLKEKQVIEIISLYCFGNYTEQVLSEIFNVARQTINDILRGKRWKHLFRDENIISKVKSKHRRK